MEKCQFSISKANKLKLTIIKTLKSKKYLNLYSTQTKKLLATVQVYL